MGEEDRWEKASQRAIPREQQLRRPAGTDCRENHLVFRGRRGGPLLLEWSVLVRGKRLATAGFLLVMEKCREEEEQKPLSSPSQLSFPHQSRQEVLAVMS